jgi:histidinol dehydrogenase
MQIYRYPSPAADKKLTAINRRSLSFRKKDIQAVTRIIDDVRRNGDKALVAYTRKFDAPQMKVNQLQVPDEDIRAAAKSVSRRFKTALKRAVNQIESFHRQQFRKSWVDPARAGVLLGQVFNPVGSAGIYVPGGQGGQTPLVS